MLLSLFYEMGLYCLFLLMLPKVIYRLITQKQYRQTFHRRLGIDFPIFEREGRPVIWVHAVSMGETKAISSLVKRLKNELDNPIILVSSVTLTGHNEAKKTIVCADHFVFLPFDFLWIVQPLLKRVSPDLVLLCETDFWYNFLRIAKKQGATVALVNGKVSQKSMKRFMLLPSFSQALFSLIDVFCLQTRLYQNRFTELGVPKEKMVVTGNLKFDDEYPYLTQEELATWKTTLGFDPRDRIVVVGSTHDPEEILILEVLEKVWEAFPEMKVVIVPRHPERFETVARILEKRHLTYVRFSKLNSKSGHERVILIDSMGLLRQCYQLAEIAIVAGSYVERVGGHNILEPCWYGVPVIFGPHMHSQSEMPDLIKEFRAGIQVHESALANTLIELLGDDEKRRIIGQGGQQMIANLKGALGRTWEALVPFLHLHLSDENFTHDL